MERAKAGAMNERYIFHSARDKIISTEIICTNKNYVESSRKRRNNEKKSPKDDMENLHVEWFLRECGWRSFINTARDVTAFSSSLLFIHLSFEMGSEYAIFMDGGNSKMM